MKDIAIGEGGLGFDSRAGQIENMHCWQRLATVEMYLRSCVDQALSCGDEPCNSLHALTYYQELTYNIEQIGLKNYF